MNIFVLDVNHKSSVRSLVDKHVVKMPLESAQMLSTIAPFYNLSTSDLYKSTHINHPCVKWLKESSFNVKWFIEYVTYLNREYHDRYNRVHKSGIVSAIFADRFLKNIKIDNEMTPFAQAMPNEYKEENAINAYRNYYINEKKHLAKWTNPGRKPNWWIE